MILRDVVYWNKNTNGVSRSCAGRWLLLSLFSSLFSFLDSMQWSHRAVCFLSTLISFPDFVDSEWNPQATWHLYLDDYNIFTCSNLSIKLLLQACSTAVSAFSVDDNSILPVAQASETWFTTKQNRKTRVAYYFYLMLREEKQIVVVKRRN